MALTAQLTTIWKTRVEAYFYKLAVYANALTNQNYKGELEKNATVEITSVGDLTVSDYTGPWVEADYESLSTTAVSFTADQLKKMIFKVDPTVQLNSAGINLIDEGAKKVVYGFSDSLDQYLASLHGAITTNVVGNSTTPVVIGFDTVAGETLPLDALELMMQGLAESNSDLSNVNVVIPPWFNTYLKKQLGFRFTPVGDKAIASQTAPGLQPYTEAGYKGIYVSNNVVNTAGDKWKVMAGSPQSGITFGMKLDEFKIFEPDLDFGTRAKALQVYGAEIPFQQHMSLGTFTKGSLVVIN